MKIKLGEVFASIQGEGQTVGIPAVFLRVSMCALDCVWCDSASVWKAGSWVHVENLVHLFEERGFYTNIETLGHHLILTGGDPLLQQKGLARFLAASASSTRHPFRWFIEVETEGVTQPDDLVPFVRLWNVSPKLSSSGMPEARRFKPDVLKWHIKAESQFKFPISGENDFLEAHEMISLLGIPKHKVSFMPVCSTQEEHVEQSKRVIEYCVKLGVRYSPRLQLALYDKATGV